MDLAARLVMRGHQLGEMTSFLYQEPGDLRPEGGSAKVREQRRAFAEVLLRQRTLVEVREVCRLCGLPAAGAKDDMVRSILAYAHSKRGDADQKQDASGYLGQALRACSVEPTAAPRRRKSSSSSNRKVWTMSNEAREACDTAARLPQRRKRSNYKVSEEEWARLSSQAPSRERTPQRRRSTARSSREACVHPSEASEWSSQKRRRSTSKRSDEVWCSLPAAPTTPPAAMKASAPSTPAKPCRRRSDRDCYIVSSTAPA